VACWAAQFLRCGLLYQPVKSVSGVRIIDTGRRVPASTGLKAALNFHSETFCNYNAMWPVWPHLGVPASSHGRPVFCNPVGWTGATSMTGGGPITTEKI
jgi:hypothetical protein